MIERIEKMRLAISKAIIIMGCIVILTGLVYWDSMESASAEREGVELSFMLGNEIINAWEGEDAYYLFLPSYAELSDVKLLPYATEFEIPERETLVIRGGDISNLTMNEKVLCKTVATKDNFIFCVMKSEHLPTVFMETDSGTHEGIWSDKTVEENGKIQVFAGDGQVLYQGGLKGIKGRGNYSFNHFNKKSMSITIKDTVSLLGLGAGTKYTLVANASDPTLIRNEIARQMEVHLQTEYSNVGRFVDLYVNGDYLGNYYLCENIEIGESRIRVTNLEAQMDLTYKKTNYDSFADYETGDKKAKLLEYNPADITGGYLMEREFVDRYKAEYSENPSGFITEAKEHFVVRSPRYCSDEQIDYLADFVNQAECALLSEDGVHPTTGISYDNYIDVDSFVKKYLVEEVTKNYDGGISSSLFYKDSDSVDGRLKAAPIWDCDMSLGSYLDWMEVFSANPQGVSRLTVHGFASPWYDALYQKAEAYKLICSYYEERVAPYMEELVLSKIEEYKEYLEASAAMNDIRWYTDLSNNPYYSDRETAFAQLADFVFARKDFLDRVWIEQEKYCIVSFVQDGVLLEVRYIKEGEELGALPEAVQNGTDFFYEGTKKKATQEDIVRQDVTITGDTE